MNSNLDLIDSFVGSIDSVVGSIAAIGAVDLGFAATVDSVNYLSCTFAAMDPVDIVD